MPIIKNPSEIQLAALQRVVASDTSAGITDIWGDFIDMYIGADASGQLLGVAAIDQRETHAELYKLYVDPEHRGQGIARALLDETFKHLRTRGIDELCIEMTESSRAFWATVASGYEVVPYDHNKVGLRIRRE